MRLSPELTPPPGRSQTSWPPFSWRQSRTPLAPAQERRDADPRLRARTRPRTSRSRARRARSPAARRPRRARRRGTREHDELGDPHPGSTVNALARVGVQEHDAQLAAVAGVDEPGRVDDRDAVPRGEARARLDEAGVAVGDRDREAGADGRPLPRREHDALAGREVEARVAGVRAARAHGVRRAGAGSGARSRRFRLARARYGASATRYGAKRRISRRGSRARTSTPSSVLALLDRRAERVQLRELAALRRTGAAAARPRSGRRSARRSARAARRGPRPSPPRPGARPGSGSRAGAGPSGSTSSILFSTSSTGSSSAPISRQHGLDGRDHLLQPVVGRRGVQRRAGRGRRRASPRASTRSPRRAASAAAG